MDNDLISREALKKEILKHREDYIDDNFFWTKLFNIIDNAPTVEPTFGLFKEMLCSECEKTPQGEYTEEDIKQAIKENFDIGYGMAKAKYERPQGEWILPNFYGDGVSYECGNCHIPHEGYIGKDGKPHGYDYCPNCGADMRGAE